MRVHMRLRLRVRLVLLRLRLATDHRRIPPITHADEAVATSQRINLPSLSWHLNTVVSECARARPHRPRACVQGAQGEVMHRDRTGAACGVTFKNVELGVLFHSSPGRAYHAATLPDCSCSSCRRRRRCARPVNSSARTRLGDVVPPVGYPRQPRPIPLPVPFCLDSEGYADPRGDSPHARFPPHMHTLQDARSW